MTEVNGCFRGNSKKSTILNFVELIFSQGVFPGWGGGGVISKPSLPTGTMSLTQSL